MTRPDPDKLLDASLNLFNEMFRIAIGESDVSAGERDRRFSDDAWATNPVYRQMGQAYLAWSNAMEDFAGCFDSWQDRERALFGTRILTAMLSPTNTLAGNPAAIREAAQTGGASLYEGMKNYLDDLVNNRGMPTQVDRSRFRVGEDLAATPGDVVFRNDVLELIQYRPTTSRVHRRPVLVIPPQIGRYYFLDMGAGRSMAEFAVASGLQLFVISWRNPGPEQAGWNLDTYVTAILAATDAVRDICGTRDLNAMGFCAGGITLTAALAYLARRKDRRIHAAAFAVTLLDYESEATVGAFRMRSLLEMSRTHSAAQGVITGEELGQLFTWMRPADLVWSYWVNNYLMGRRPPDFDILAWNADSTNLPAALHADFLTMFQDNVFCEPGTWEVLGVPLDPSTIELDTFVTGGLTDHITPWQGCYRTTQLLGGDSTFVLSSSGHIASLVNPPGNPRASYRVSGAGDADPETWLQGAVQHPGSWWECWRDWLTSRSGKRVSAPGKSGSPACPPLEPAPGRYVFS